MSHKVNIGYCPACQDHIDGEPWMAVPLFAASMLRAHIECCDAVDTMAYVLVGEVEAALSKRCDYRRGPFCCQRVACTGEHLMAWGKPPEEGA